MKISRLTVNVALFFFVVLGNIRISTSEPAAEAQRLLKAVKTLPDREESEHDRAPILFWHGNTFTYSDEELKTLHKKGVVPALKILEAEVERAARFTKLGLPIYLLEGRGSGKWPYSLKSEYRQIEDNWQRLFPSPFDIEGWFVLSQHIRQSMKAYKEAGTIVDGVFYDFELFPRGVTLQYFSNSEQLREQFANPERSYSDEEIAYYQHNYESALHSAYLAAPVKEVWPNAQITNWGVYCNSHTDPIVSADTTKLRNQSTGLFNTSNTFAYGWDRAYAYWRPFKAEHLSDDAVYFWSILKQTSEDARNQVRFCPMMHTSTWVSRYVRDDLKNEMPLMDRGIYQGALLHLWMRGVDNMLVFNPIRDEYPNLWIEELVDALWSANKIEPYWAALQRGRLLNLSLNPISEFNGTWSGVEYEGHYTVVTTCFKRECTFSVPLKDGTMETLIVESGTHLLEF